MIKLRLKIDAAKSDGKKKDVTDLKAGDFATVVNTVIKVNTLWNIFTVYL